MRKKEAVRARGMITARAWRIADGMPWRFTVHLGDTDGLTLVEGRETLVTLTAEELARVIETLPTSSVESPGDLEAIGRVKRLLRSAAFNKEG
jgi:hypothetical protein